MATPKEAEVKRILAVNARALALRMSMLRAWSDVEEKYPDRGWWRRKATRAGLMWEYAVKHVIDDLGTDVRAVPHNDTISLIFDDALLIRPKKADFALKTRNYPTQTALMFHEPEVDLFGFEGLQRIELVYVPNQYDTSIDWIGIVARDNSRVIWSFELEAGESAAEVLPLLPSDTESEAAELATLKKGADVDKRGGERE